MSAGTTAFLNRSKSRGGGLPAGPRRGGRGAPAPPWEPPGPSRPPSGPPSRSLPSPLSPYAPSGLVDHFPAPLADPRLLAFGEGADPGPGRLTTLPAHHHYVRQVQRALALDDAPLAQLLGRALVTLDHVDLLDDHAPPGGQHDQHLSALAALLAGDDRHGVALLHMSGQ